VTVNREIYKYCREKYNRDNSNIMQNNTKRRLEKKEENKRLCGMTI
jgi:hypothetical protein